MSEGRILGVDYGEKRVGLALSDPLGLTAQPLQLLDRKTDTQLADDIQELVRKHEVERVIVGLPVGMSGDESSRAKRTRKFITLLRRCVPVPVEKWDERLSTVEADRTLREAHVRASRRRGRRDIIAAQLILQGYLDRNRTNPAMLG